MSVLLIGDTHGDASVWGPALELAGRDLELVLHTGDVLAHGPRNPIVPGYAPLKLAEAIKACPVPVLIAKGNCDADIDEQVLEIPLIYPLVLAPAAGRTVLVTHGDRFPKEQLPALAARYRVSLALFGHIHLPVLDKVGEVWLVNPGSPSLSKHQVQGKQVDTVGLLDKSGIRLLTFPQGTILAQAQF